MLKKVIYIHIKEKRVNQFAIRYMTNPTLHVNKVIIEKFEKCLRKTLHKSTMTGKRNVLKKIRVLLH